ncbi:NAD(P)-binding protein [Xylona heveae TC161]|uniref:NAD(P)-binding protein n=1 Tax=Xylona heveae (strain CBS 132557 / TC161) TaxID=1328760 RepID=A0A165HW39_XYLHT|nr:NAD(P)-binding protein [Xylona heveae TC161]KZF24005.1 NAD(P)-binding protein [Xylona heveae TC161]
MAGDLVLLTGGTGMIGFRTLVFVLQKGFRVRCAVRNQAGFERIKSLPSISNYVDRLEPVIVPDITAKGAYDEAVQGVKYILHIASPLASPNFTDFENEVIIPAIKGTVGILESAVKPAAKGIKRVVIVSSIVALVPPQAMFGPDPKTYTEADRAPEPQGGYENGMAAYIASKAFALQATEAFVKEKQPEFDVVNICPSYVLGRDETVTDAKQITKGTNGFAVGQLLGSPAPYSVPSASVHLDDVATLLVESLNPRIPGNQCYLATSQAIEGTTWAAAFDIVKRYYPKQVSEGILKVDGKSTSTNPIRFDPSHTEKTFGITFKGYVDQITSIVDHYLVLLGKE